MEELSSAMPQEGGIIKRLITGKLGLVDTFWGAYFLGGIIFNVVIKALQDVNALFIFNMIYAVYILVVCIGVWKAASLYQGKVYWAVLAKITAAISIANSLVMLFALPMAIMGI
ncbi:hypothetical protein [Shewanella sp. cp20]|uniref:hypothetical protein n=1 Tax=Shewanella sp. cp20 TaxID=1521167 RepID=UPI0005A1F115|nr:hypothetical protein [Shewanella sp. cp20]KIO35884.1 hypothetical protein DB48_14430 [Shewanella sp. cp20]